MKARGWIVTVVLLLGLGYGIWLLRAWKNQPPEIPVARAMRETIESVVPTNGKVEPAEFAEARAEVAGRVDKIHVQLRQRVDAGAVLVEFDTGSLRAELESIEAKVGGVKANLDVISAGGKQIDRVNLQSQIDVLNVDLKAAQEELAKSTRLEPQGGATKQEVIVNRNKVEGLQAQIGALEERKRSLVSAADRRPFEAQLRELDAEKKRVELQVQQSSVRAPISGEIYQFDLKPGAYLNPGDIVAAIGKLDMVHVKVYVDEPDLGRVRKDLPVTITWDATPGREWKGTVDRLPTQIVAQGTRQVGEVVCVIPNPDQELRPGTNVTVRIESEVVKDTIAIPKDAVFRENGVFGVYLVSGDRLQWKPITQGISSVSRTEVKDLKDGDVVALRSDRVYRDGMQVQPAAE